MKKALIFSLAYHPWYGGAEVALKEITSRLEEFSFDMITVNLNGRESKTEKIGNTNVFRIGRGKVSKYFYPWAAVRVAEKMHQKENYHTVWAMMANQAGLAASFFKKNHPEIPFLLTLQEGDSEFDIWLRTFFARPLYKSIYRRADAIQAISNFLAQRAKNFGAKCPITVVPNGVNISPLIPGRLRMLNIPGNLKVSATFLSHGSGGLQASISQNGVFGRSRKKEGGSCPHERGSNFPEQKAKIIITASRLEKKNAVDVLMRAIKELRITNYELDTKLVILGSGSQENYLKQLARDLGIESRVEFYGHIKPEEVYTYLQTAALFVRPSRSEGLGSAFLEAMSCGVPVIGTSVGGIPDFLKDGETGLFCNVNDSKDLAAKIQKLLSDEVLYRKISENGKKLIFEKYQWTEISKKINSIFNFLIEKRGDIV